MDAFFTVRQRTAPIIATLFWLCHAAPGHAEMISLAPIKPKVVLYDVALDPVITFMLEIATKKSEASFRADGYASVDASTLTTKIKAIADRLLPYEIKVEGCSALRIDRLDSLEISVVGSTGDVRASVFVTPSGCLLPPGNVSVDLRFVPSVTPMRLGTKVVSTKAQIPWQWFVAYLGGKKPDKIIEAELTKNIETIALTALTIQGGRTAFLGASLDAKGGAVLFRLRAEMQVSGVAATNYLTMSEWFKNFSFEYPPPPGKISEKE